MAPFPTHGIISIDEDEVKGKIDQVANFMKSGWGISMHVDPSTINVKEIYGVTMQKAKAFACQESGIGRITIFPFRDEKVAKTTFKRKLKCYVIFSIESDFKEVQSGGIGFAVPTVRDNCPGAIKIHLEKYQRKGFGCLEQGKTVKKTVTKLSKGGGDNWKCFLVGEIASKNKLTTPPKLDYTTVEIGDGFTATVASEHFKKSTEYTGKECKSKTDAEKDAAKVALKEEFPKTFPKYAQAAKQATAKTAPAAGHDYKSTLVQAVTVLLGRVPSKEDIVYDTTNIKDQTFKSKVTLAGLEGESFQGAAMTGKKEAEHDAAKKALKVIKPKAEEKRGSSIGIKSKAPAKPDEAKQRQKELRAALSQKLQAVNDSNKVYCGGLTATSQAKLKAACEKIGKVDIHQAMTPYSAVVVFKNASDAAKAIAKLNCTKVGDAVVELSAWQRKAK